MQPESDQADETSAASDLETSARLVEEATREWHAVAASLRDLKKALAPDDFASALAQMKVPGLETLISDWREAQADYRKLARKEPAVSHGERGADRNAARRKRTTARFEPARKAVATGAGPVARPARPSTSRSGRSSSARETPDDATGIQKQLAELTSLLRQHVESAADRGSSSRVEIPRQLTLSIAREVAGRVKDSVLETLRERGAERSGRDRGSESSGDYRPEVKSKKVPLDDIAAMIDHLTKL